MQESCEAHICVYNAFSFHLACLLSAVGDEMGIFFFPLLLIKPLITLGIHHKDARLRDVSICLSRDATANVAAEVEKEPSQSVTLRLWHILNSLWSHASSFFKLEKKNPSIYTNMQSIITERGSDLEVSFRLQRRGLLVQLSFKLRMFHPEPPPWFLREGVRPRECKRSWHGCSWPRAL